MSGAKRAWTQNQNKEFDQLRNGLGHILNSDCAVLSKNETLSATFKIINAKHLVKDFIRKKPSETLNNLIAQSFPKCDVDKFYMLFDKDGTFLTVEGPDENIYRTGYNKIDLLGNFENITDKDENGNNSTFIHTYPPDALDEMFKRKLSNESYSFIGWWHWIKTKRENKKIHPFLIRIKWTNNFLLTEWECLDNLINSYNVSSVDEHIHNSLNVLKSNVEKSINYNMEFYSSSLNQYSNQFELTQKNLYHEVDLTSLKKIQKIHSSCLAEEEKLNKFYGTIIHRRMNDEYYPFFVTFNKIDIHSPISIMLTSRRIWNEEEYSIFSYLEIMFSELNQLILNDPLQSLITNKICMNTSISDVKIVDFERRITSEILMDFFLMKTVPIILKEDLSTKNHLNWNISSVESSDSGISITKRRRSSDNESIDFSETTNTIIEEFDETLKKLFESSNITLFDNKLTEDDLELIINEFETEYPS
ncbi:hypothetical protein SNEBB_010714 [Seison nebaliae]|nr:hypothetical protein SNEBB_010714 [Seison nebaliae]